MSDEQPRGHGRRWVRMVVCAVTVCAAGLAGCLVEYDFEREPQQLGTLGEEVHAIWLKDAARAPEDAEKKAQLLETRRAEFVGAVDTVAPPAELAAIDGFLQGTLGMIDDGTLPGLTRKTRVALQEASRDEQLLRALGDASRPQPADFISPIAAPDLIGYVTAYPNLRELGLKGSRLVLDNDGFTDAGEPNPGEPNGVSELVRELSIALEGVDAAQIGDPLAILVRDLLLNEDERFAVADATRPLYVAIYDTRGLPRPNPEVADELFMDADADGRPDVNAAGEFMTPGGGTIPAEAFADQSGLLTSDPYGRARSRERFAFDYIDLNETGLAFLIREYAALAEQDVLTDLLATLRVIMGPTIIHEDARGPYRGFNPDNPLMDLSWGLVHALAYDGLPDLMQATADFMAEGDRQIAGVVVGLEEGVEIAKRYPEAELEPTETMLFDMIPVLHEIAQDPALWRDFMNALGDPITPRVGDAMVTLLSYRNTKAEVTIGGPYDACFQGCKDTHTLGSVERFECIRTTCPTGEIFQEPMDYSAPETPESRSQLQAIWHLMWGLSGVPYEMSLDEVRIGGNTTPMPPPLIALPGGAEAFLRSVAGNLTLAEAVPEELFTGNEIGPILNAFGISAENIAGMVEFLSQLFGVKLSREPTPDQLTRMFTQEDIAYREGETLIDVAEPVNADGYKLAEGLADGLFEAEASGLIDAIYPVAKAFSDHDKEHLLLELFSVLHMHYPRDPTVYRTKDGRQSPSQAANLRSFEPVIRDLLAEGRLLQGLYELSVQLQRVEEVKGVDLTEQLRVFVLHATRPGSLTTRDGSDFINLPDGRTARDLTPMHILAYALDQVSARVKEDPQAPERLRRAVGALMDLALAAEWPAGEQPRFVKDGSVALTIGTTQYLADQARKKRDAGQLRSWLLEDAYGFLDELWTSRLLNGLVLIAEQLLEDPDNRAVLDDLTAYLVGTPRGREHTTMIAYQLVLRSVNTQVWVPLAQSLSRILDPDRDWGTGRRARLPILSHGALALEGIMQSDPDGVGIALINRGLERPGEQKAPLFIIGDVLAQYFRVDPSDTGQLGPEDYREFFTEMAAWMADEAKGLEQLYDLVDLRVREP